MPLHKPEITLSTNNSVGHLKCVFQWLSGDATGVFSNQIENKQYRTAPTTDRPDWYSKNIDFSENHSHAINVNTIGNNETHNNLQPYSVCSIWKRIS